jgi:outer membrane protein
MKKYFLILLTVLFSMMAGAQETPAKYLFTLEECLQYAMDRNYNRQTLKLAEESSQAAFRQAKDERLPAVNASLSENFTHSAKNSVNGLTTGGSSVGGSYGVNASIPVYQGGAIKNAIEQSRLQMEQSGYQTSQYENELTIQILQAFLSVLGNEELMKYQSSVMEASREQLLQGKEQFRFGSILESDYLLFEAQYANDLNNRVDTEIARNNNLLTLKVLLSMDPAIDLQIVYPDTSAISGMAILPTQIDVTERALSYLPDMKISQYNVDIANTSIAVAKAGYYPTVSLGAGLGTGHTDFSNVGTQLNNRLNEQIGITVSIPVFDRNRTKTNVTRSKIALRQAELSQRQTELNLRQTVMQEYQDVVSAYNKYQVTDVRQNACLRSFEAYGVQFNAGAITPVELLQQQNNYISALNDFIQSKYRFMLKRKILDVYMGEPVRF